MATRLQCPRCAGEFQTDQLAVGFIPCPDCGAGLVVREAIPLGQRLSDAVHRNPVATMGAFAGLLLLLVFVAAAAKWRAGPEADGPQIADRLGAPTEAAFPERQKPTPKPAARSSKVPIPSPEEQQGLVMKQLREETWPNPYPAIKLHSPVVASEGEVLCTGGGNFLTLDRKHRYLYMSYGGIRRDGKIERVPLSGGKRETLVEGDLSSIVRGPVLDIEGGKMYWFCYNDNQPGRIQRADLDGHNVENVIIGMEGVTHVAFDPASRRLFWEHRGKIVYLEVEPVGQHQVADPRGNATKVREFFTTNHVEDKNKVRSMYVDQPAKSLFMAVSQGITRNALGLSIPLDGTAATNSFPRKREIYQLLRDPLHETYYWTDVEGLRRARSDGLHMEHFVRGEVWHFAVDWEDRQLYAVVKYDRRTTINRIPVPPEPETVLLQAPPRIDRLDPGTARSGEAVRILGEHFTQAHAVTFIDDSTGEPMLAEYQIISDAEIVATVPNLRPSCKRPVITVQTDGGVTFTLDEQAWVVPATWYSIEDRIHTSNKIPVMDDEPFVKVLHVPPRAGLPPATSRSVSRLEMSVVLSLPDTTANLGPRGGNVVFLRNDTGVIGRSTVNNTIYHEPLARVPYKGTDGNEYIAVPAIRASMIDKLWEYSPERAAAAVSGGAR